MNTRLLMALSAFALGSIGLIFTFMPQELSLFVGVSPVQPIVYGVELAGALYLSFSILNWMAKGNLIGGIYSRPVALANFMHFSVGTSILAKVVLNQQSGLALWALIIFYLTFAVLFSLVLFRHPQIQQKRITAQTT